MGVWIEMTCQFQNHTEKDVAPFVGVWIEMASYFCLGGKIMVAPFVGVWIEIDQIKIRKGKDMSLPSWECGLKSLIMCLCLSVSYSRSLRGSVD